MIRDPKQFKRFFRLVALTPYSRQEFEEAFDTWGETDDPVERAHRWYVVARQAFSGEHARRSWSYCRTESSAGMSRSTLRWLAAVERLPEIYERWMPVQIEHQDFRAILPRFDTPESLFYCDPPYHPETRKSGGYRVEMTAQDHVELVDLLLRLEGKCILSGYRHPVYERLEEAGWRRHEVKVTATSAGRTRRTKLLGEGADQANQVRTECIWISPRVEEGQGRFRFDRAPAIDTGVHDDSVEGR